MKTLIAIIIKFVGVWAAAWIAFMVFGTARFWTVFVIACVVTAANYLIGDLLVLPKWGNIWASIIDGILAGAAAWAVLYYTPLAFNFYNGIWIFALIIVVAEFFFHMYLFSAHVVEQKKSSYKFNKNLNYNMESGSELFPYPRRSNIGANADQSKNRFTNENTFRNADPGYDARESDTGGDWYSTGSHSSNVENKWYNGSGSHSKSSGSSGRSGKRFSKKK